MDSRESKLIISYMYVSKNLKKDPKEAIRYIKQNKDLFKNISEKQLEEVRKERGITTTSLKKKG